MWTRFVFQYLCFSRVPDIYYDNSIMLNHRKKRKLVINGFYFFSTFNSLFIFHDILTQIILLMTLTADDNKTLFIIDRICIIFFYLNHSDRKTRYKNMWALFEFQYLCISRALDMYYDIFMKLNQVKSSKLIVKVSFIIEKY